MAQWTIVPEQKGQGLPLLTVLQVSPSTDNESSPKDSGITSTDSNGAAGSDAELKNLLTQGGLVLVGLILLYAISTSIWTMATGMATSAAGAMGDELVREAGNVGNAMVSLVTLIFSLVWEGAKVVLPAVFKAVSAGVEVASPMVQEYSQAAYEAASPYVGEATSKLSEAAAPYVEQVNAAVDTTIVAPFTSAVDANLVAPIKEATGSITSAVDSTIQGATDSVTSTIDSALKGVLPF